MDEREALQRAIADAPDDDLPRLVFADWVEEHGETEYAVFIRVQVELAKTPPWEPFAVHCKHHAVEYVTGAPWWNTLPAVDGYGLEWHPEYALRRGFGRSLIVRDMMTLFAEAPRLFDLAPIEQLHLPTATLDNWRRFVAQPWLSRIKSLYFYGTRTPIEPVRELCASPPLLLNELVFEASSRPGMPDLIEGLMRSPLGRQLRSLELRAGPDDAAELFEAIGYADPIPRLERFTLTTMGAHSHRTERLFYSPVFERLTTLELINVSGVEPSSAFDFLPSLTQLRVCGCQIDGPGAWWLSQFPGAAGLRAVDLSDNPIGDWNDVWVDLTLDGLDELRSLSLRRARFEDEILKSRLTETRFWPRLVELDLRDNYISDSLAASLLGAPIPPDLTALLLTGNSISADVRTRLREHFGARAIL